MTSQFALVERRRHDIAAAFAAPSSECENQIAPFFYGLPLKPGTLDPPSAVILQHAPVYSWKPPTLLSVFKTPG